MSYIVEAEATKEEGNPIKVTLETQDVCPTQLPLLTLKRHCLGL